MKMSIMKMSRSWNSSDHFSCDSVDCAGKARSRREKGDADGSAEGPTTATEAELIYKAKRASSDLPDFLLALAEAPEAAESSSLGGVGSVGTISAALALSSRNLSNSGRKFSCV